MLITWQAGRGYSEIPPFGAINEKYNFFLKEIINIIEKVVYHLEVYICYFEMRYNAI